jgi:hypothetical protein
MELNINFYGDFYSMIEKQRKQVMFAIFSSKHIKENIMRAMEMQLFWEDHS